MHYRMHRPLAVAAIAAVVIIIAANCYVYFEMCSAYGAAAFTPHEVFAWGGMTTSSIILGGYGRLLTSAYVHFSPIHIGSNMLALLGFGLPVARRMGGLRFLVAYTLCGLAGSIMFLAIGPENVVAAGASGAIAGLPGMLLSLRMQGDTSISGKELISTIGFNAALPFLVPNIAWQDHLGGFVAGLFLGWLIVSPHRGTPANEVDSLGNQPSRAQDVFAGPQCKAQDDRLSHPLGPADRIEPRL